MKHWIQLAAIGLAMGCTGGKSASVADSGPGGPGSGGGTGTGSAGTGTGTGGGGAANSPLDLISAADYAGLRVQIDYVRGKEPSARVLGMVQRELDDLLASGHLVKPSGIELVLDEEVPAVGADTVSTFEELDTKLRATKGDNAVGDAAVIHALWVDGQYEPDRDSGGVTLGFAYGGNKFVMLADNVQSSCDTFLGGPLGAGLDQSLCDVTEASVWMHELGHLFGLVDNGVPMVTPHNDPDHGHHDIDQDCLMYWAIESGAAFEAIAGSIGLGGPEVKQFDDACLADLMAAQTGR